MKPLSIVALSLGLLHQCGLAFVVNAGEDDTLRDRALRLMAETPLIDTHIDLPQILAGLSK